MTVSICVEAVWMHTMLGVLDAREVILSECVFVFHMKHRLITLLHKHSENLEFKMYQFVFCFWTGGGNAGDSSSSNGVTLH